MLAARRLCGRTLARSSSFQTTPLRRWKQTSSDPSAPPVASSSDATDGALLEKLSRPLGVTRKPSAAAQSWEEKKAEMFDYDKHIERRRHL